MPSARPLLALAVATTALPASAQADLPFETRAVARSDAMIWNAVAVRAGRVFVAGPRWTDGRGPQVAVLDASGRPQPFPQAAWNSWRKGLPNGSAFINVNSIHLDRNGALWVVDTGSPEFGGDPLPDGAKLVQIDLDRDQVIRVIPLGGGVLRKGSYVDDIRFNGAHAYLTDAGSPGIIVVDLKTGASRRVLDGHPAATAKEGRPIVLGREIVRGPDGSALKVHSDPLEVSPDGAWLFFGPLEGPWSRVPTRLLDDPTTSSSDLAAAVSPWADLPPVGGTAMDADGSLYFTDLAADSVKVRRPDGRIETLATDPALHWVDAPFLAGDGSLWLPVAQMDRVALFHDGQPQVRWPIELRVLRLEKRWPSGSSARRTARARALREAR